MRGLPAAGTFQGRAEPHWYRGANIKTSSGETLDAIAATRAVAPTSTPASTPRKVSRVEWADTAKGLSIIGVCLMHIVTAVPDGTSTPLGLLSSFLDPLRMPLFFLVSGLFAHRVLERTLGDLWYRRLWFLLVPYLVFTPFQALIRLHMAGNADLSHLIQAILFGDPGLWFLYTLMVYNIVAWLLRRQPAVVALALSFVPICAGMMTGWVQTHSFRQAFIYMPIFFAGLHFRTWFFALANKAGNAAVIVGTFGIFVAWEFVYRYMEAVVFQDWDIVIFSQNAFLALIRTFTAVPFGVVLAVWLSNTPLVSRFLTFVGANTLPIYVSHHAMMWLFMDVIARGLADGDPDRYGFLTETYPLMLLGFAACLFAGALFYNVGKVPVLKWILYPPALPRRGATRLHSTAEQHPTPRQQCASSTQTRS